MPRPTQLRFDGLRGPERLTLLAGGMLVVLAASLLILGWQFAATIRVSRINAEKSAATMVARVAEEILDVTLVRGLGILLESFAPALGAPDDRLRAIVAEMDRRAVDHPRLCRCDAIVPLSMAIMQPGTEIVEAAGDARRPLTDKARRALTALADTAPVNLRIIRAVLIDDGEIPAVLFVRVLQSATGKRVAAAAVVSTAEFATKVIGPVHRDVVRAQFGDFAGNDSLFGVVVSLLDGTPVYRSSWNGEGLKHRASTSVGAGDLLHATVTLNPALTSRVVLGGVPAVPGRLLVVFGFLMVSIVAAGLLALMRARQLMTARTLFLSGVSHELRTPLTQVLMYAEMLQMSDGDAARRQRATEVIVRETRRLIHMIENMLLFARGPERDLPLNLRPERLASIVESAMEDLGPLLARHETRTALKLDPDLFARVDAAAVRQVLGNLVDNALRYGPPGQCIRIQLAAADSKAALTVEDEGPGIPLALRGRVLQPFERGLAPATTEGSGIGLALVQQLVTAMSGSVRIESAIPHGARVVVLLPRADSVRETWVA